MTKNPIMHGRTKHIEIKYHSIRDLIIAIEIKQEFYTMKYHLTDLFLKTPPQAWFESFQAQLAIYNFNSRKSVED